MQNNDWLTVKTNISQAFWCELKHDQKATFTKAVIKERAIEGVSWFDEMFYGGIKFPLIPSRPATFLITGPPGSGKSTLALELCYRLADIQIKKGQNIGNKTEPWFCLYISADMNSTQVIQKALSFGWKNVNDRFFQGIDCLPKTFGTHGLVTIFGAEDIKKKNGISEAISTVLSQGIDLLELFPPNIIPEEVQLSKLAKMFSRWMKNRSSLEKKISNITPDVVVIDSLNTLQFEEKLNYFEKFLDSSSGRTKLLIFILDSDSDSGSHESWEYMSDYVIRIGYDSTQEYFLRSIEIVKARYQDHVLGKQQIKIYPSRYEYCLKKDEVPCTGESEDCKLDVKSKRSAHPYRYEGGLFIYPSIHYYLSKYKRYSPIGKPTFADTRPEALGGRKWGHTLICD